MLPSLRLLIAATLLLALALLGGLALLARAPSGALILNARTHLPPLHALDPDATAPSRNAAVRADELKKLLSATTMPLRAETGEASDDEATRVDVPAAASIEPASERASAVAMTPPELEPAVEAPTSGPETAALPAPQPQEPAPEPTSVATAATSAPDPGPTQTETASVADDPAPAAPARAEEPPQSANPVIAVPESPVVAAKEPETIPAPGPAASERSEEAEKAAAEANVPVASLYPADEPAAQPSLDPVPWPKTRAEKPAKERRARTAKRRPAAKPKPVAKPRVVRRAAPPPRRVARRAPSAPPASPNASGWNQGGFGGQGFGQQQTFGGFGAR